MFKVTPSNMLPLASGIPVWLRFIIRWMPHLNAGVLVALGMIVVDLLNSGIRS